MSLIDEMKTDMQLHPLDRNPAVMARACERIAELERQLAERGEPIGEVTLSAIYPDSGDDKYRHEFTSYSRIPVGAELFLYPQSPEWQPIETAPKDGTAILVTNGYGVWLAKHKTVYQSGFKPNSPWFSLMLNKDHIPGKFRAGKPTHWMPLPAAPQSGVKP